MVRRASISGRLLAFAPAQGLPAATLQGRRLLVANGRVGELGLLERHCIPATLGGSFVAATWEKQVVTRRPELPGSMGKKRCGVVVVDGGVGRNEEEKGEGRRERRGCSCPQLDCTKVLACNYQHLAIQGIYYCLPKVPS